MLNLQQASELIGRDRTTLHDDVRLGKLRGVRMGRRWLVYESDLLEFDKKPRVLPGPRSRLSDPRVAAKLERLLEQGVTVLDAMNAIGVGQPRYYRE
ncbi:MAG: helix-turn-helix domain-containing protein, partial [Acidimicrobiales bacterium]